ncbi:hypothetical protein [Streptomyces sp. CB01881]|nr:hypothetical protein [Streptomyces sp. CB01881]
MTTPSRLLLAAALLSCAALAACGCYGNKYDLVLDAQGRILRIEELYHP